MTEHPEGKRVANSKRYRVKRRNSSARVTRYLVILFAAAFLMLLLAFFIQQRDVEVAREESDSLSPASVSIGVE